VLIAGPTASGKSRLALEIAERTGGTVVNADSMQVYADLRVLTARPGDEDLTRAPHRLYGHVDGAEAYSVGRYIDDVERLIAEVSAAGTPGGPLIFVGGTGLYFKALTEGLSPIPQIPTEIRERWRTYAATHSNAKLHAVLAERDDLMAKRLPAGDTQRIVRALEVFEATGRSLAEWQTQEGIAPLKDWGIVPLVLTGDREVLYERADARFAAMIGDGALDEVHGLMQRDLPASLPIMRAVGVMPLIRHLRGEVSLQDVISEAQRDTRQYIKRQLTWLRKNMCNWNDVQITNNYSNTSTIVTNIISQVDEASHAP
jgi:tRNA dimethylallyltransferase